MEQRIKFIVIQKSVDNKITQILFIR